MNSAPEDYKKSEPLKIESASSEGDEAENLWIISYADLMTLLFGFFAMLFSFATFDSDDYVKISKEVAKHFGGSFLAPTKELAGKIDAQWKKSPYSNDMVITSTEDAIEITFISSVMFGSGSADIVPEVAKPIGGLIDLIKQSKLDVRVTVEGHTDNVPISTVRFPSNWELSASRATAIVRLFIAEGFRTDRLGATGFGDSRPSVPNEDPQGRSIPENNARNRRVVVKILPVKVVNPLKDALKDAKPADPFADIGTPPAAAP